MYEKCLGQCLAYSVMCPLALIVAVFLFVPVVVQSLSCV